jgi:hypothetical protein
LESFSNLKQKPQENLRQAGVISQKKSRRANAPAAKRQNNPGCIKREQTPQEAQQQYFEKWLSFDCASFPSGHE